MWWNLNKKSFGWKIFFFSPVFLFWTRKLSNKIISKPSIVQFKVIIRFLYAQKEYNASFIMVPSLSFFYYHYTNSRTSMSHKSGTDSHVVDVTQLLIVGWMYIFGLVSFEGNFLSRQLPVPLCFQDPNVACSPLQFTLMYLMPWLRCNVQQLLFLIPRYFTS